MFGPVLKGDRVTLRPADDSDPPRFVPWFADMEVTRYLGRRSAVALYMEEEILKRFGESDDTVFWMIEAGGETIGATGIHAIDWLSRHATTSATELQRPSVRGRRSRAMVQVGEA